jgi:hypothetical protein
LGGNEGTHYPLFYQFGPGIVPVENRNNEIFTEKDDYGPNEIIYDLDNNKIITSGETEARPKTPEVVKKVYSRNVNRKNRGVRKY